MSKRNFVIGARLFFGLLTLAAIGTRNELRYLPTARGLRDARRGVMPVVTVLDWLYRPPQSTLAVKQIAYWLIFPLLYLAYSIIRGASMGFYAYPFFNPDKVGGYGGVFLYCVAILVVFLFVSWLLLTLANKVKPTLPS